MLRPFMVLVILSCHASLAWADGGTLRLSEKRGSLQISVFTAPTPLRAGPVDVSVFVQEASTGKVRSDLPVTVRAFPIRELSKIVKGTATAEGASNKLFRAVTLDLGEPGPWQMEVRVVTPEGPVDLTLAVEVGEPMPPWINLGLWIGWPLLAVGLFAVHQWLVRQRTCRN